MLSNIKRIITSHPLETALTVYLILTGSFAVLNYPWWNLAFYALLSAGAISYCFHRCIPLGILAAIWHLLSIAIVSKLWGDFGLLVGIAMLIIYIIIVKKKHSGKNTSDPEVSVEPESETEPETETESETEVLELENQDYAVSTNEAGTTIVEFEFPK